LGWEIMAAGYGREEDSAVFKVLAKDLEKGK
jgi:hypothetical protein